MCSKGKKKGEKVEDELSPEDEELKTQMELLVTRAQDKELEIRKAALQAMVTEIRTATSSMTSVPKPLKFLRPHYGTLKETQGEMQGRITELEAAIKQAQEGKANDKQELEMVVQMHNAKYNEMPLEAGFRGLAPVVFVAPSGLGDEMHVVLGVQLPEPAAGGVAVHGGHADVQEGHVGLSVSETGESLIDFDSNAVLQTNRSGVATSRCCADRSPRSSNLW